MNPAELYRQALHFSQKMLFYAEPKESCSSSWDIDLIKKALKPSFL